LVNKYKNVLNTVRDSDPQSVRFRRNPKTTQIKSNQEKCLNQPLPLYSKKKRKKKELDLERKKKKTHVTISIIVSNTTKIASRKYHNFHPKEAKKKKKDKQHQINEIQNSEKQQEMTAQRRD